MTVRICCQIVMALVVVSFSKQLGSAATIAVAKALPLGSAVTLDNVVISNTIDLINSGSSASFNVQDSSGGATIFGSNAGIAIVLSGLARGDRINVNGTTGSFNGQFQLSQPFLSAELVAPGVGVPAPIPTSLGDFQNSSPTAENLENKLVALSNVRFTGLSPGQTFAGTTSYTVTDGIRSGSVRIQTSSIAVVGDLIPTGNVNLSGIFSQFDVSNPLPGVPGVGYQLLLLEDASIQAVPEPSSSTWIVIAAAIGVRRKRHKRVGRPHETSS